MNYIIINQDEVDDVVYANYLKLPHADIYDNHIVFYTVGNAKAITDACLEYTDLIDDRNDYNDAEDYDGAFEVECTQRDLAEELISLIDD